MPVRRLLLAPAALLVLLPLAACAEDHGKYARGEVADDVEWVLPAPAAEVDCDDEEGLFVEDETITCPVLDADDDAGGDRIGEVDMVRDGDTMTFELRLDGQAPYTGSVVLDDIEDL